MVHSVPGFLLLEDGTLFRGLVTADLPPMVAEVVFTTNMTGYQEVFTDPSYKGQIVVMTTPLIGNYGINTEDPESANPQVAGVIVRELSPTHSNWRATGDLEGWLTAAQIPILREVDTRRLTRHLRSAGVMRGVIAAGGDGTSNTTATPSASAGPYTRPVGMDGNGNRTCVESLRRSAVEGPSTATVSPRVGFALGLRSAVVRLGWAPGRVELFTLVVGSSARASACNSTCKSACDLARAAFRKRWPTTGVLSGS